ncbi:MAG TPA: Asp-tRNA(Asn)/Glu-tRNA(Gln) amidotransferase subunit GatC [Patescibacteria group bacterium]|nr:Asp-tRNA(Asn)/Glu-tRNA(Gln) amidotransferase subunit GatC [Patescibacteria group bacterium]
MSLDIQQIDHLAHLARLDLTAGEKELYASQLAAVFDYFQKLQAVDTTGLEPMSQVIELQNIFYADDITSHPEVSQQKIIDNAPAQSGRHLKVKKIL